MKAFIPAVMAVIVLCLGLRAVAQGPPPLPHFKDMDFSTNGWQYRYEWWIPKRLRKALTTDSFMPEPPVYFEHSQKYIVDYSRYYRFLKDRLHGKSDASYSAAREQILHALDDGTLSRLFNRAIDQAQRDPHNPLVMYRWMFAAYTLAKSEDKLSLNNVINTIPYALFIPPDPDVPTYERFRFRGFPDYEMPSEQHQHGYAIGCAKLMLKISHMPVCPLWFKYKTVSYLGEHTYSFYPSAEALLDSLRGPQGTTLHWQQVNADYWNYRAWKTIDRSAKHGAVLHGRLSPQVAVIATKVAALYSALERTYRLRHNATMVHYCRVCQFFIYDRVRQIMPKGWKPPHLYKLSNTPTATNSKSSK